MKLTAIFLFAFCMHVAGKGLAQTLSLSVKNEPLQKVMERIQKQTGYSFFYNAAWLEKAKPVTVEVKDQDLPTTLGLVFKDQPLEYTIINNTIVLKLKPDHVKDVDDGSAATSIPPPIDITGRITNEQGQPLSGASVIIKRTGHGDIANANGNFTLKNINSDDILVVSYVGYKQQKIKVGNITSFTIVMEVATDDLDAVRVQAYGMTTDRLRTANIATVTASEIGKQPVTNALQTLQGQVPGLIVTQTNGYESAPFKVEIRGRNTIANVPSDPLYVVDGVPLTILEVGGGSFYANGSTGFTQSPNNFNGPAGGQSPFFSINPSDIESITVLKDADATAIYGSRAANGAIIITTKKGSPGKTKLEGRVYEGMTAVTRHFSMLNTQQYLQMRREAFKNDNIIPNNGNAYDLLVWDTTRYTDWQKFLWGNTGKQIDAQLDLSGGDKQNTFRIGAGFRRVTDITTAKGVKQRGSIQFNLTHKSLDQHLSFSFTNFYSYAVDNMIAIGGLATLPPDAPAVFNSDGKLNYAGWAPVSYLFPFSNLLNTYTAKTNFLNSQALVKYQLMKGLSASANLGYSNALVASHSINPIAGQNPLSNPKGGSSFGNNNTANWIVEPQLEHESRIDRGKLDVLLGFSTQNVSYSGSTIFGHGYLNDNLLGSISNAASVEAADSYAQYKYAALFSRINYDWADKYIIDLSGRRDGSSRFGSGKQFGNFGSVGFAYIFSEENFIKKNLSFLSFGKLRGSYGTTGNDQIGEYQFLTRWSSNNVVPYDGNSSYLPLQHANPDYQWEVNKKLEIALDLGFLKDRIYFETAIYQNRCNNQLISYTLPQLTGFSSVTANSPAAVQNRGLEFVLKGIMLDKKDIVWNAKFNLGFNDNKLLAYPNLAQSTNANRLFIGQPLYIQQFLHYIGINPQNGQYIFEDKNKDGSINNRIGPGGDLYIFNLNPKFAGGFSSEFRYKGFTASAFFDFRKQMGRNAFLNIPTPGGRFNEPVQVMNRWTKPNDVAIYARFTTNPKITDIYFGSSSDAVFTDASFIRLTNLHISYSIPSKILKATGINFCNFYMEGQNLLYITKYKGLDPETQNFGQMPIVRTLVAGIQFTL